jgi:hypothetical protein
MRWQVPDIVWEDADEQSREWFDQAADAIESLTAENAELSELVRVVTVMFAPVLGDAERPHVWNTVALRPDLTPEQAALIRDVCRGEGT